MSDCEVRPFWVSLGGVPPEQVIVVRLLESLEADHYLERQGAGSQFASELVRRAWISFRR